MSAVNQSDQDTEHYRREALGAFAHELRTPLTSMRMVLELAAQQSGSEALILDGELAAMLDTSLQDLQQLVDDLQDLSRIERKRAVIADGPANLAVTLCDAIASLGPSVNVTHDEVPPIVGPWDPSLLTRALAGCAESANRAGDGSGEVTLCFAVTEDAVELVFRSGEPSAEMRPVAADVGFAFFRSRDFIEAMGGHVSLERGRRYASVTAVLPL